MGRLIDADAMLARLEEWNTSDSTDKALYNFTMHRILEAPTIAPVRKGKWIDKHAGIATCSECGDRWGVHSMMKFCPSCGAKMEEPEDIPMEYFESGGR